MFRFSIETLICSLCNVLGVFLYFFLAVQLEQEQQLSILHPHVVQALVDLYSSLSKSLPIGLEIQERKLSVWGQLMYL